jgi:hypothetical protein
MRRTAFAVTGLALLSAALTGCTPSYACPAIGWINVVEIHIMGSADAVASMEVCDETKCTTTDPETAPEGTLPWTIAQKNTDTWQAWLNMDAPDNVAVRATDATGATLADEPMKLSWKRVGGSEQCGGPGRAVVDIAV